MSAVQVNNSKGGPLTKVKSGLTVAEVLKRIRFFGFLEDKDGFACGDDDIVVAESAPYVFKKEGQPSVPDDVATLRMNAWVEHWRQSDVSLKRKRETEDVPIPLDEADELFSSQLNPTTETAQSSISQDVEEFPPENDFRWYLGSEKENLYIRNSMRDLGELVFEMLGRLQEDEGPAVFVITGAAGIGKSWSINMFMSRLLHAKKKVFFHSGAASKAWKIDNDTTCTVEMAEIGDIAFLEKEWIYVYDSPGTKSADDKGSQARNRIGPGQITLIFSSPKAANYDFAVSKSNGLRMFFHVPTWRLTELLCVKSGEEEAVRACYDIWGGSIRALESFLSRKREQGLEEAKAAAEKEVDAQVDLIDRAFARKVATLLQKHDVQQQFVGMAVQNAPGHIIVPEPTVVDPQSKDCFENFHWRFCSPLAEEKFWKRVKTIGHDEIRKLLINVFQTPSAKGVLFEKIAHTLITNGVVKQFQCRPYMINNEDSREKTDSTMEFQQCRKVIKFESGELSAKIMESITDLGSELGTIALEPKYTSFDAVDMFLVSKHCTEDSAKSLSFYMIQDTISKTHSFHAVKVMSYCSVFCDAARGRFTAENLSAATLLDSCKYVPVVPKESNFAFETATSKMNWANLDRVAKQFGFRWPNEFNQLNVDWKALVTSQNLVIPPTLKGKPRKLDRNSVGNALLLKFAEKEVKERCTVIYDVVKSCRKEAPSSDSGADC